MIRVRVQNNNVVEALKRLKRLRQREGLPWRERKHGYFHETERERRRRRSWVLAAKRRRQGEI